MRPIVCLGAILFVVAGCSSVPREASPSRSGVRPGSVSQAPSERPSPVLATDTSASSSSVAGPDSIRPVAGEPWIAYQGQADGGYGVDLVRLDGTGIHWPMQGIAGQFQEHPDWSPDGDRLAFSETAVDGTEDLWVAGIDGSNAAQIVDCRTPCLWADEPAWSPDGTSIVFQRTVVANGRRISTIELFDVAHRTTRTVLTAKNGTSFYAPRWSPDGRSLVAEHAVNGATSEDPPSANAIVVIDLSAAAPTLREITTPDRLANNPDWSPRGDQIVFCLPAPKAGFEGPADLYAIAPEGGSMRRLTSLVEAGGRAIQPTFTPDATSVLFALDGPPGTDRGLASVPVAGGDPRSATSSGYLVGVHPRMRPTP